MKTVHFYTKPGCHLCELALEVVERVRVVVPFSLELIDITGERELEERYRYDIPVVLLDGREVFRHHVYEEDLVRLLD
ncbi:glutaredoxin family protein [Prosthecochloris sp. N3]|uniref:Glutaredoxin family protein n=1 Tax=Prosthecochloris ethylica TaxID=2743976 RepID=A0ABR9XS33_9CHLB|nr:MULTISPECIES: glutaredoxin family protein [Prosthecochloris]MBF0586863.1 glutaredoxin family protein [Prosthecochloris ethylica]MBF0636789.1 glutaredoxin family protein [Prosthecochloris ethylica]NUK48005.1 glutaredoxin family protein [Prosthecochloris ethylica]RNA64298.1 glutaredoxin family protein [Prosthecochloris sp. ZM_2]